ncbi:MAG TPA: alpha/beta fold hydrolase, partial [Verrucomicrobiae bacterium]|nr:alpha/beta fold hydrolase [Verrucomicrobiae bacterium]
MPRIRVGQVELFYQRTGPARPPSLVLIMGWGGDHTAWALQVAALAAEFDVIAFDNRGAGQSDAPDVTYSMADLAEDVTGLMDELGVRSAHIAGASMGGMIAQEVALRYPDRVLSLQLHCTTAHVDEWAARSSITFSAPRPTAAWRSSPSSCCPGSSAGRPSRSGATSSRCGSSEPSSI